MPFSCVNCGSTSTPMRRQGPLGPGTLCNRCGIREAKAAKKRLEDAALVYESGQLIERMRLSFVLNPE